MLTFRTLAIKWEVNIFLKKFSCVFLPASFIPASFILASVIIASVCIQYIYVYFCMNQQMTMQQLVGRSIDADVDVVFAGDGGRLVVADVAVKSFKFRLVAVYAPNIVVERVSFFRRLAPFLDDTKRLVLMGDWNAILDPKIDKVGRGARRVGRFWKQPCRPHESSWPRRQISSGSPRAGDVDVAR